MLPAVFLTVFFTAVLFVARAVRGKARGELDEFRKTRSRCGLSGAEVARRILHCGGAATVEVVDAGPGELNRYLPRVKKLELDRATYHSHSLTAMALASRAATQAIQHRENYPPFLWRREAIRLNRAAVLIAMIAFAAVLAARLGNFHLLAVATVIGWTGLVILNLFTLPVEWDANKRALQYLTADRLIARDSGERDDLGALLAAAAWHDSAAILDSFTSPFGPIKRMFRGRP